MPKAIRWMLCLTLVLACAPVAAEDQAPGEAEVRTAVKALARIGAVVTA